MHVTIGIMDCGNLIKITDDYANMKTDALNALIKQVQDAMDNPDYGYYDLRNVLFPGWIR